MIRILRFSETDLDAAVRELSSRLSLRCGMVSSAAMRRTAEVCGRELSPLDAVRVILADVRKRGDEAVTEYTRKLDGCDLTPGRFRVTREEMAEAYEAIPPRLREALAKAKENIWSYQEHILHRPPPPFQNAEGGMVTLRHEPIGRVGIYVPGGRAAYPSTVLMTAIPAQVAGVREIALVTPPDREGRIRPEVLAAAHEVGLTEVYRIGGAQAVGALAYGTVTIRKVDMIVGPGNIFVTLAKREVYGEVAIDMPAGPSEVMIIADAEAEPGFIAADLLSQAEHDPAAAVLLTPDEDVARRTADEIERQLGDLPRAEAAGACLDQYGLIAVTRDLDHAVALANEFAPEHLELMVKDPKSLLPKVRSAGAIFVGPYTPEPVGDYIAGPSHVLPTGGGARFFSGLSANDFIRTAAVMVYPRRALEESAGRIVTIACAEGLDAHARAAAIRFEKR